MSPKNYFKFLSFPKKPGAFSIQCLLLYLCLFGLMNSWTVTAQIRRVVAVGSSTTVGIGATSPDSSWIGLINKYYKCRLGIIDSAYNLGVAGTNTYYGMPSGYIPPPSRPNPDTAHNVSKANFILKNLSTPDYGVVIVNYPTNDYNTYSIAEIMNSLQLIYDSATAAGNRCYISTTQPRCDIAFNNSTVKKKLADIKDSILNRFGTAHTLNFWDGLYNPADTTILTKYSAGDCVHFNNAGHRVLFERVIAKNIFNLPVWYSKNTGNLDELSTWGSNADGSGSSPESFTTNYQVFNVINNPSPTIGASWLLSGKNIQLIIGDGINPVDILIPADKFIQVTSPPPNNCY